MEIIETILAVSSLFCALLLAWGMRKALNRIPPALCFLSAGMIVRLLSPFHARANLFGKPLLDMSLAVIGLQIGSHMNNDVLGPIRISIVKFFLIFVPCVMIVVSIACAPLFPVSLRIYSPLVASIAIERSSPEALVGVTEIKAKGSFTSSTICIAASQDVLALITFAISSSFLGSGSALISLVHVLASTIVGVVVGSITPFATRWVPLPSYSTVLLAILSLVVVHYRIHSELLLSAVLVGIFVNYFEKHPMTDVIEQHSETFNLILFSLMGHRIFLPAYIDSIFPAFCLFAARIFGLWIGSWGGTIAAGFAVEHKHVRWMGLVTQLAVALSLLARMEDSFPEATPMARAYGGAVLFGLLTGPSALIYVLRRVGEAQQFSELKRESPVPL